MLHLGLLHCHLIRHATRLHTARQTATHTTGSSHLHSTSHTAAHTTASEAAAIHLGLHRVGTKTTATKAGLCAGVVGDECGRQLTAHTAAVGIHPADHRAGHCATINAAGQSAGQARTWQATAHPSSAA